MVARAELRHRLAGVVALGLCVGLGLGAALGAFIAADRTEHAYGEYVDAGARHRPRPQPESRHAGRWTGRSGGSRTCATSPPTCCSTPGRRPSNATTRSATSPATEQAGEVRGSPDSRFRAVDRPDRRGRPRAHRARRRCSSRARRGASLERRLGHAIRRRRPRPGRVLLVRRRSRDRPVGRRPAGTPVPARPRAPARLGVRPARRRGAQRRALSARERLIVSPDVVRRYDCLSDPTATRDSRASSDEERSSGWPRRSSRGLRVATTATTR